MSREASLIILTATITTQPRDVTVCNGGVAVFTCVVDRNSTDITSDDVMWQMIRISGGISTLSTSLTGGIRFNITTTISGDILTSIFTITGVTDSSVLGTSSYRCVVNDMMSRNASLYISTATITAQPRDVTVCTGGVAVFTCVVDWNGTDITCDDVMWQQIRMNGGISTLSTSLTGRVPFNITTTVSGDILTSTLTITGVTHSNTLGTSLYHCVVNDMMSRDASPLISTGPPGTPMNIRVSNITSTSFVVQWDEVDDVHWYIVNWKDDGGSVRESTTSLTSHTITQLSPNTTYNVTVTTGNICGSGPVSDILIVTTNVTLLIGLFITTWPSVTPSILSTMMLLTASSSAPCVCMSAQSQSDSSSLSTGVAVAVTFIIHHHINCFCCHHIFDHICHC
ncbi:tyrosine-protein kinase receptor TYRO3-like isoform X2 [Dysidea avara]|uniref:tyrosine-protein kinase receptor TYRO3-like isoform X2 n=1 Tax=Dysidea avara TaxID=196820 RepID=UPI00331E504C